MGRFLGGFVEARFWLVGVFAGIYYLQLYILHNSSVRIGCLWLLIAQLAVAAAANYMWVVDYRDRLASGISFLRTTGLANASDDQVLEQCRWSNAKMLGVVAIILEVLGTLIEKRDAIPLDQRVPALLVAMLILASLFDAALDLEAEWTICMMAGKKSADPKDVVPLAGAIWHTNQFREHQKKLHAHLRGANAPPVTMACFSGAARNLISFAIVIVLGMIGWLIWLLHAQLATLI